MPEAVFSGCCQFIKISFLSVFISLLKAELFFKSNAKKDFCYFVITTIPQLFWDWKERKRFSLLFLFYSILIVLSFIHSLIPTVYYFIYFLLLDWVKYIFGLNRDWEFFYFKDFFSYFIFCSIFGLNRDWEIFLLIFIYLKLLYYLIELNVFFCPNWDWEFLSILKIFSYFIFYSTT